MVICQNCGFEARDNAKFCPRCGSDITNQDNDIPHTVFCSGCGFEMPSSVKFCPQCGTSTTGEEPAKVNYGPVVKSAKDPLIATVLSFFIVGLGQIYLGFTKKGIILFAAAVISLFLLAFVFGGVLFVIVWAYGIYDAYTTAVKMKET